MRPLAAFLSGVFCFLCTACPAPADYSIQHYAPGSLYKAFCLVDMTGDGMLDVVAGNSTARTVEIWSYDERLDSLVLCESIPGIAFDINSIAAADLDHDGDQDVVVGLRFYGLYICFNDIAGWRIVEVDPTYSWQVFAADFDRDGNLDIFDSTDWGYLQIFYGDGAGGFIQGPAPPSVHDYGAAHGFNAVDLNDDLRLDLLGASYEYYPDEHFLRAYLNQGEPGSMAWSASVGPPKPIPGLASCAHSSGDLDGNGHADLVCMHTEGVDVYRGREEGGSLYWECQVVGAYPSGVRIAAAYDANSDGDLDILVAGGEVFTGLDIYYGNGAGGFTRVAYPLDHGTGYALGFCAGDVRGKGWCDLVSSRYTDSADGFELFCWIPESGPTAEPQILSILDVGNDQGRQVRLRWLRSRHDAPGDPIITGYGIYRGQDPLRAGNMTGGGPEPAPSPLGLCLDGWDFLLTVPARGDSIYQVLAPTLCDSTAAGGICWSAFFVSAMTIDPLVYFDSAPDSGYSVDNLAPAAPGNLRFASPTLLVWEEAGEQDLDYFTVYGLDADQQGEAGVVLGHTTETRMEISGRTYPCYRVTATDVAGNEGEAATLGDCVDGPNGNLAGDGRNLLVVQPARPSPSAGETTIWLDVPARSAVTLEVRDLEGRSVITLVSGTLGPGRHAIPWSGMDRFGRSVPAGIYLYEVRAGALLTAGRIVRLK